MVALLVESLHDLVDEMTNVTWAEIQRRVGRGYAGFSSEQVLEAKRRIRRCYLVFFTSASDRRRLGPEDLAVGHTLGSRRAEESFPVETVIASVEVAMDVCYRYLRREAARLPATPEAVEALGELGLCLGNFIHDLTAAVRSGYDEQLARWTNAPTPQGLVQAVLGTRLAEWAVRAAEERVGERLGPLAGLLVVLAKDDTDLDRVQGVLLSQTPGAHWVEVLQAAVQRIGIAWVGEDS